MANFARIKRKILLKLPKSDKETKCKHNISMGYLSLH